MRFGAKPTEMREVMTVRRFRKAFWPTDDTEQARFASVLGVTLSVLLSLTIISVRHPVWCIIAAIVGALIFRAVAIKVLENYVGPKAPRYDSLTLIVVFCVVATAIGILIAIPSGNPLLWAEVLGIAAGGWPRRQSSLTISHRVL
jgi:hypothetical protein